MTHADRISSEQIRHEIEFGTPNTPQRVETMRRADEAYARSFARPQFRDKVRDWIVALPHDEVLDAFYAVLDEWRVDAETIKAAHLKEFLETLVDRTL